MSEAEPSSGPVPQEGAERAPLALEPLTLEPPPAFAATTTASPSRDVPGAAAPPARRTAASREPAAASAKRRFGSPVATSIAIHVFVFALAFLLLPLPYDAPPEPETRITIRLREHHFVGDDPESDGTGPRGPGPNVPPPEPVKGKEVVPGFLEDDTFRATAGVGAGARGSAFAGRLDGKEGLVAAGGGDGATEGAVRMALEWLARHQEENGTWNARRFVKRCPETPCAGAAEEEDYVTATTAMALLPFLGAGHTHRDGPWKDVVRRGLAALHERQLPDGRFDTTPRRAYADAIATLAVCEAYGLTKSPPLGEMAARAVSFWVRTQGDEGGWRYEPGDGHGDSSVTGWVAMALSSARKSGVEVPDGTLVRCRGWFRDHTDEGGVVGYTVAGTGSKSLLGVGYLCRVMLGDAPDEPGLAATGRRLELAMPRWPESDADLGTAFGVADPVHWYYGATAAFQRGGGAWRAWNERLRPLLLDHQDRRGCAAGSWPPVGETGANGGRVVVTALCALALEVYYRYPRVTGRER